MLAHVIENADPVKPPVGPINNVRDVGAVEAFTAYYEQLRREQVLGRDNLRRHARDRSLQRSLHPAFVNHDHGIAHAGNEIHEVLAAKRFRQPHWIGHLAFKAMTAQPLDGAGNIFGFHEQIEVFCNPANSRVLL